MIRRAAARIGTFRPALRTDAGAVCTGNRHRYAAGSFAPGSRTALFSAAAAVLNTRAGTNATVVTAALPGRTANAVTVNLSRRADADTVYATLSARTGNAAHSAILRIGLQIFAIAAATSLPRAATTRPAGGLTRRANAVSA